MAGGPRRHENSGGKGESARIMDLRAVGLNFSNNSTAGRSAGSHLAAKAVGKPVYELFRLEWLCKSYKI